MTWTIVDDETGNMVADFDDEQVAFDAFEEAIASYPERRDALVLVALDDSGYVIKGWGSQDLYSRP